MPVVLEFVAVNREIRRRAEPKVFVDVFREFHRRRAFADRVARAVMVDASGENFAERFFFVQELFDFRLHFVAALLHPDLANALGFAGGGVFHQVQYLRGRGFLEGRGGADLQHAKWRRGSANGRKWRR